MADKPNSGELLGIPYNFERPSLGRLFSSYWKPGKGILVEKPFGVGYTLNLANPRSWVILAVAGAMLWMERKGNREAADPEGEPVEVTVEE